MTQRIALAGFTALWLAGCSLTQPPTTGGAPAETDAEVIARTPGDGAGSGVLAPVQPAAAQFIGEAARWRADGDAARAAAALERAIRIDARHPQPWLALAELRLAEGDLAQARNLAGKARALSPAGSDWQRQADALLSRLR